MIYRTSKTRHDFIIKVNINANLSLNIPKLGVSYCLNRWDVALDWLFTAYTSVQTLLQSSTSASKAPVALKLYVCNINQLSNRYLNKLQYTVDSQRSALSTEKSLLIAELVQCDQKCNIYKLPFVQECLAQFAARILLCQRSELPVRELVPKGDPIFLYQDLEDKKTKILCEILLNLTPTVLSPQAINTLYFKSESNKFQQKQLFITLQLLYFSGSFA